MDKPDEFTEAIMEEIFPDLPPHKPWYKFGFESPRVLWVRLTHVHPWVSRHGVRWSKQRWRRGWSDYDAWGFDYYLARVIAEGVSYMREIAHGYPNGSTPEEWAQILQEIEDGMRASIKIMDGFLPDDAPEHEQFKLAMNHLEKWWFSLWD